MQALFLKIFRPAQPTAIRKSGWPDYSSAHGQFIKAAGRTTARPTAIRKSGCCAVDAACAAHLLLHGLGAPLMG